MKTKQSTQRQTRQRQAIQDIFKSSPGPLTIKELHEKAQAHGKIGIATIYRTISLMLENKEIKESHFADGVARYESAGHQHHHHHFLCRKCGFATCVDVCPINLSQLNNINQEFTIESHELTLHGLCSKCA